MELRFGDTIQIIGLPFFKNVRGTVVDLDAVSGQYQISLRINTEHILKWLPSTNLQKVSKG